MSFASIVIKNTARMKAVEVSSPLRFAYPKSLLSYIYIYMYVFSRALVKGIIQGESAVEKRDPHCI